MHDWKSERNLALGRFGSEQAKLKQIRQQAPGRAFGQPGDPLDLARSTFAPAKCLSSSREASGFSVGCFVA